ncbi:MAG: hypothetical protein MPK06_08580 [Alphaproteobacteria bacterium]|nr:hypothetical protein [Alphaproteobacteria bacterium]MDA8004818.1 hypothetical protein [Alphaproteobacteria bacterium]MDA8006562.1 hypothetical protein [Alphaproteobacteria bacterium]MDA8013972.1 hypothetical protein [Alphaproteobacteria bacterium]
MTTSKSKTRAKAKTAPAPVTATAKKVTKRTTTKAPFLAGEVRHLALMGD